MKEFDSIIGYEAVKAELMQICDVLKNREYYKNLGVRPPRGLLLYGKPGVGKTLMANCLINASGYNKFICRKDKPNGEFVNEIKKTFDSAAEAEPSVVFLDDLDKFSNGDERHKDKEEYVTVQSCIDEVKDKKVFVIATANKLSAMPESLMRVGRFDRTIKIHNPRGEEAKKIIEYYLKKTNCADTLDAKEISKLMFEKTCAELETVINEAGIFAGYERSDVITMKHFLNAYLHTLFNVSIDALSKGELNAPLSDRNNLMTGIIYHEAGHATVSEVLRPDSVTLVSAYGHFGKPGGYTRYYLYDDTVVDDPRINVIGGLGGCAGSELKFGQRDIGSSADFDNAFEIVREMLTQDCLGNFSLRSYGWDSSDYLKSSQEKAVAVEVERYYMKAKEIIAANFGFFEGVAHALAKKGVLTSADIRKIKKDNPLVPVGI